MVVGLLDGLCVLSLMVAGLLDGLRVVTLRGLRGVGFLVGLRVGDLDGDFRTAAGNGNND